MSTEVIEIPIEHAPPSPVRDLKIDAGLIVRVYEAMQDKGFVPDRNHLIFAAHIVYLHSLLYPESVKNLHSMCCTLAQWIWDHIKDEPGYPDLREWLSGEFGIEDNTVVANVLRAEDRIVA